MGAIMDMADPFYCVLGTHRLENGVYTGRTIDIGISSSGTGTTAPLQRLGPADHDLLTYDFPLKGTRRGWRWQPRRLLAGETTSDWNKLWADVGNEFTALLDVGNTEARRIQLFKAGEAGEQAVFGARLPPMAKGTVNKQGKRRRAPTNITYGKCKRVVQTPKEIAEHLCKFVVGGRRVSSQQRLQDKTAGSVHDGILRAFAIFEVGDDQLRQDHLLGALAWPVTSSDFTVKHVCSARGGFWTRLGDTEGKTCRSAGTGVRYREEANLRQLAGHPGVGGETVTIALDYLREKDGVRHDERTELARGLGHHA